MLSKPIFEARDIAEHRQNLITLYAVWMKVTSQAKAPSQPGTDMEFTFQAFNELLDRVTGPTVFEEPC